MSGLDQYYTPTWAAELLLARHFPELGAGDTVLDPSCGDGRFMLALPDGVTGLGVEIDPIAAEQARGNTGYEILTGDFLKVSLPVRPSAVVGNPPFQSKTVEKFMDHCYELLEYEGRVGFILPVYMFQTASTVMRLSKKWSIAQELIPRNIFKNLEKPLLFATFRKDRRTVLSGFFLYSEVEALESLKAEYRERFVGNKSRANVWGETVYAALKTLGGRAKLSELYAEIENHRPTANPFWREQVRKVAMQMFTRVAPGEYAG